MIISEIVNIKMNSKHITRYRTLGYMCKVNEFIEVRIEHLTKSSRALILAKCDFCFSEKEIKYCDYNIIFSNGNMFSCSRKCSVLKAEKTNLERYGVKNTLQSSEIKEKIKKTNLERYGVENYSKTDEFKINLKKTNLERYGVEFFNNRIKAEKTNLERYGVNNVSKLDIVKLKKIHTSLNNWGVENPLQSDIIKFKIKETNIDKYGVEFPSQFLFFREKAKETNLERYGVEHYSKTDEFKEKVKETNLERYGVEFPSQLDKFKEKTKNTSLERYDVRHYSKTDEFKERVKKTNNERYGVEFPSQLDKFKQKTKKTNLDKYGVEFPSQSKIIRSKVKKTNNEKYGVDNYKKTEGYHSNTLIGNDINYIKYLDNNLSLFNCSDGHKFEISSYNYHGRKKSNISLCTVCNPIGDSKSIKEKDILKFIQSNYNGEIISSYRDKLEIDIYLPELKIGFEFNGLYWHSDKFNSIDEHLFKSKHFKDRDIRIVNIWEDDWDFKRNIVESQILNLVGKSDRIYARKCVVREVSVKETRKFLDNNHIQGFTNSSFKIGLYLDNELVSIMTFDTFEGRKKMKEGGYNLNRFCNKLGYSVVGGASKLLSYFIKVNKVKRIISYADKDCSVGSLYYTLGFENVGEGKPDYKYVINNKRVHKSRYKKSRLNTDITELQATKNLGINRIYDCGKIKFELRF